MRHYDKTVNITWVMAHYNAAVKYIESGHGSGEATGGSDWKNTCCQNTKDVFSSQNYGQKKN